MGALGGAATARLMCGKTFRVADRASAEPGPSSAMDIGFGCSSLCVLYHACCAQSVAASKHFSSQKLRLLLLFHASCIRQTPRHICVPYCTVPSSWVRFNLIGFVIV